MSQILSTGTDHLLEKIDHLISTLHCVQMDLKLLPEKDHHINFIQFQDLQELRNDFVEALLLSTSNYVFSRDEIAKKVRELDNMSVHAANVFVHKNAVKTFRVDNIKGQFSELLLFNLLQHHFRAVPLVRKMKITTNPKLERNGADAIHISINNGEPILYLGEAKTYTSGFKAAFKNSIASLLTAHAEYRSELNLYYHNEFLAPELREFAKKFVAGKMLDVQVHSVALISYEREVIGSSECREEIIQMIIDGVREECSGINPLDYPDWGNYPTMRMNYILMPFQKLEDVLSEFQKRLR